MLSSPPCWWKYTIDLSLARLFVHQHLLSVSLEIGWKITNRGDICTNTEKTTAWSRQDNSWSEMKHCKIFPNERGETMWRAWGRDEMHVSFCLEQHSGFIHSQWIFCDMKCDIWSYSQSTCQSQVYRNLCFDLSFTKLFNMREKCVIYWHFIFTWNHDI